MPKDVIDYSNTIIYKLCCRDPSVTEVYVGHTTNFTKRKYQHKQQWMMNKKLPIYGTIRSTGGWDNWTMVELARYACKNASEARLREKEHVDTECSSASVRHTYDCDLCGQKCSTSTGLSNHQHTTCVAPTNPQITAELVMELIKDNQEMKQIILEQHHTLHHLVKNGISHNSHNTYTNSHNKAFNLNVFLNETCKGAMNINEFVESIQVQLCDLERFSEIGYVENISNIITTNLKALHVTERPVHCTDKKRETIYIKDNNKWEKEDPARTRLRKAIRKIASKNYKLLPEYREKHPGCQFADSVHSDKYNKMVVEAMGGSGNENEKEDKIIRNISKNIVLDKEGLVLDKEGLVSDEKQVKNLP